jgi:hypothetical protein
MRKEAVEIRNSAGRKSLSAPLTLLLGPTDTRWNTGMEIIEWKDAQIFQKSRYHLTILGAKKPI